MTRAALIALTLLLLTPDAARACFVPIDTPGERMTQGRWVTVATATVTEVRSRSTDRSNRAFEAAFEIDRMVEGYPQTGRLRLWHEELTECPTVLPLPKAGETWAVYLEWDARGNGPVSEAWPLSWSRRLDPRFGGRPDADMRDLEPPHGD